jgi:hypothetical protein
MALLAGKPFGKDGSICKPCLRAFISLFTSVCNLWVILRVKTEGLSRPRFCKQGRLR